jgi:UMF1 family MFS transporter
MDRGSEPTVWAALLLFTVANVAFELTFVFYNAFLPGLGTERTIGRLSGYGWALGYAGGLLSLAVCLGCIGVGQLEPWLPEGGHLNVRATNLVVAAWFALFALPMFAVVRDHGAAAAPGPKATVWDALWHVARSLRALPSYPDLLRLLLARLFYNDATLALITLSGLFMAGTLQMDRSSIILVGIWLNVAAGLGALAFGFIDDFLGAKTAILGSLVLLLCGSLLGIFAPSVEVFVVAATLAGLGMGPNQAASRTMLARFVPPSRSAEFYGLFALSGKATVWLGPLLFSVVRAATEGHPHSLFAVGAVLLWGVDERRGAARGAGSAP